MTEKNQSGDSVRLKVSKIDAIVAYTITESELVALEQGSPNSYYLNAVCFFFPTALSFLIALFTTKIENNNVAISFWVIVFVSLIMGLFFLVMWIVSLFKCKKVSEIIRKRFRNQFKDEEVAKKNKDETSTVGNLKKRK